MTTRFIVLALAALPLFAQQSIIGVANVKDFGATGNTQEVSDATMANGTSTVMSPSGLFVPGDVGRECVITSYTGQTLNWQGGSACTITGYTSSTTITVSITASTSYSYATFDWGNDDTTAISHCVSSLFPAGGTCYFPPGRYMTSGGGVAISSSNVTLRGADRYASVLVRNHDDSRGGDLLILGATSSALPMAGFDAEALGFDGLWLGNIASPQGNRAVGPTFNNCRFYRVQTAIYGSFKGGTITNSLFESPGTFTGHGAYFQSSVNAFRIAGNTCRFMNSCIIVGSSAPNAEVSDDVEISGNSLDGGWFMGGTTYANSGGTVTYTAGTLVDTSANFPTLIAYTPIRVLPVRTTGTAGSASTILTDLGADFITAGVLPADLVKMGGAFALVDGVQDATHLLVEQWLSETTMLPVIPATGAYTVYRVLLGGYISTGSSATRLATLGGVWHDYYGNAVTPAAGTPYEVSYGPPNYQINMLQSAERIRIVNNSLKRGWADQITIFGKDVTVIGNDISDGYDVGITVDGSGHTVTGNHVFHQGSTGIWAGCNNCMVAENNISYSTWCNLQNTTSLGDITIEADASTLSNITVVGNVLTGGSNASPWSSSIHRYGIAIRSTNRYGVSEVCISNNLASNHTVADVELTSVSGGTVSGVTIANSGTILALGGATYAPLSTNGGAIRCNEALRGRRFPAVRK